jgi:hypothetical protein
MRGELDFVQWRCPDAEGPHEKVSRYTGCPVTQGWTLVSFQKDTQFNDQDIVCDDGARYHRGWAAEL